MAAELLNARALAPLLGAGIHAWAGVIAATLIWAGTGAMLSTRLAAKNEKAAAGTWLGLTGASLAWSAWITTNIPGTLEPTVARATIATSLTIGPAALCLGALMPTATARATKKSGDPDRAAAWTSAATTAGSVVGTLGTPLLILPYMGTNTAMGTLGVLCAALGAAILRDTKTILCLILAGAALANLAEETGGPSRIFGETIMVKESPYQRIAVRKNTRGEKTLILNSQVAGSEMEGVNSIDFLPWAGLEGKEKARALYLGGGAFLVPKVHAQSRPQDEITVAEIDEDVVKAVEEYFGIPPEIKKRIGDGRKILEEQPEGSLDMIFCDTYLDAEEVPAHMASAEFFDLCARKLKKDGVVLVNAVGKTAGPSRRISMLASALSTAFPETDCHRETGKDMGENANYMIRGSGAPLPEAEKGSESKMVAVTPKKLPPPTDRFNPPN